MLRVECREPLLLCLLASAKSCFVVVNMRNIFPACCSCALLFLRGLQFVRVGKGQRTWQRAIPVGRKSAALDEVE